MTSALAATLVRGGSATASDRSYDVSIEASSPNWRSPSATTRSRVSFGMEPSAGIGLDYQSHRDVGAVRAQRHDGGSEQLPHLRPWDLVDGDADMGDTAVADGRPASAVIAAMFLGRGWLNRHAPGRFSGQNGATGASTTGRALSNSDIADARTSQMPG